MSIQEYTERFQLGPFNIEVTHHEWDCGDGCCSTSGNTAIITEEGKNKWYYGCEGQDGHFTCKGFADKALTQYLKERDLSIQVDKKDALLVQYQELSERSSDYLSGLAMSWILFGDILNEDILKKSKIAQEYKSKIIILCKELYSLSNPHQLTLYLYRDNLEALETNTDQ
jgi:hypothetical protein